MVPVRWYLGNRHALPWCCLFSDQNLLLELSRGGIFCIHIASKDSDTWYAGVPREFWTVLRPQTYIFTIICKFSTE
jgi:hypothetical protein